MFLLYVQFILQDNRSQVAVFIFSGPRLCPPETSRNIIEYIILNVYALVCNICVYIFTSFALADVQTFIPKWIMHLFKKKKRKWDESGFHHGFLF